MPILRSCCLCIAPKTAAFITGSVGIVFACLLLAPLVVFLEYHNIYITQFARNQRENGNYMDDDEVPEVMMFSKILYSIILSIDVMYIFSCIFLLVGIMSKKHLLMIPWLVYMFILLLVFVTLEISFIIGLKDYASLAVFLGSSPVLFCLVYVWLVNLAAYQMLRLGSKKILGPSSSASLSSIVSIKEGIQRVLGGTPPPPYEAVTTDTGSPKKRRGSSQFSKISPESNTSQTVFFDITSTRRSSNETTSTKPASPLTCKNKENPNSNTSIAEVEHHLHLQKAEQPDIEAIFSSKNRLAESVSSTNLCDRKSTFNITKSSSWYDNRSSFKKTRNTESNKEEPKEVKIKEDDLLTTWSSLSDETSSLSSTSIANETNNILV